ncbi:MAG: TonB-dependent receptor [Ignavibacteriota bacterium]
MECSQCGGGLSRPRTHRRAATDYELLSHGDQRTARVGALPERAPCGQPDHGDGSEITITGIANFGGTNAAGDRYGEKIPSFSDNFTKVQGTHTIKAGFAWQLNNDNQIGDVFSQYTFSSIASYLAAKSGANPFAYSTFQTVLGVPGASYKSYFYDFYVQDTWQVRPHLTLIYGVRWDRFQAPAGEANAPFVWTQHFTTPNRDWAPRLGFAWQFTPKTVLRASSGLFYEAPPTNLWYNSFINDGSTRSFTDTFQPGTPNAPAFPNVFNFLPGATLPRDPQHFRGDP